MTGGLLLVAAAGPASNLCLALAGAGVLGVASRLASGGLGADAFQVLQMFIVLNVLLAAFNLLPIPPLDGSRVADALMPHRLRPLWDGVMRYGAILLLAVLALPLVGGFNILWWPQAWAMRLIELVKP
jgi:Zn-dependent protease